MSDFPSDMSQTDFAAISSAMNFERVTCHQSKDKKHQLKLIDFNEDTFVGTFKCRKCKNEFERKPACIYEGETSEAD